MARSVPEWIGKTDDTKVPPRVRTRVFIAKDGRCHKCKRKVNAAVEPWTCEHLKSIGNGGPNRESNLGVTCSNCLPAKNADDAAEKKVVARKRAKHLGVTQPKGDIQSRGFAKKPKAEKIPLPPRSSLYA